MGTRAAIPSFVPWQGWISAGQGTGAVIAAILPELPEGCWSVNSCFRRSGHRVSWGFPPFSLVLLAVCRRERSILRLHLLAGAGMGCGSSRPRFRMSWEVHPGCVPSENLPGAMAKLPVASQGAGGVPPSPTASLEPFPCWIPSCQCSQQPQILGLPQTTPRSPAWERCFPPWVPQCCCELCPSWASPAFIGEGLFLVTPQCHHLKARKGIHPMPWHRQDWEEEDGHDLTPVPWWALGLKGRSPLCGTVGQVPSVLAQQGGTCSSERPPRQVLPHRGVPSMAVTMTGAILEAETPKS